MSFWDNVKADLQKGFKEGVDALKEGAVVVRQKAEELTEEGKKRYKLYEMKNAVQIQIAELGGKIYDLVGKIDNPVNDAQVKNIIKKIKKLELDIEKLEGKKKAPVKKKAAAPRKKAGKKNTKAK